jgi:hypothetical protein
MYIRYRQNVTRLFRQCHVRMCIVIAIASRDHRYAFPRVLSRRKKDRPAALSNHKETPSSSSSDFLPSASFLDTGIGTGSEAVALVGTADG